MVKVGDNQESTFNKLLNVTAGFMLQQSFLSNVGREQSILFIKYCDIIDIIIGEEKALLR